jgi:hypothetical protein
LLHPPSPPPPPPPLELCSRRDARRTRPSRELRRCCGVLPGVWMGGWRWIGEGVAGRGGCQHPCHRHSTTQHNTEASEQLGAPEVANKEKNLGDEAAGAPERGGASGG